jgi:glycosyltransferase involved in cell wall biosynthesis
MTVTAQSADMLKPPQLTVAMPVFNGGGYLRLSILSILQQTFTDWELLLIDDGSTDGAVSKLAEIHDPRIRIISDGKNHGLAARLNQAIGLARGQYFARMDHDDIAHPERFLLQISKLQSDPLLDLVGAQCVTISENGELLGGLPKAESHQEICARPWLGFYLAHPTWMGKTEWFRKHLYTTPGPYCCEDQDLLLRTHAVSRFYALPKSLLAYRLRNQLGLKKAWRTRVTLYKVQLQYFKGSGQYALIPLSTFVFLLRVVKDLFVVGKQLVLGVPSQQSATRCMPDTEASEWKMILRRFVEERAIK